MAKRRRSNTGIPGLSFSYKRALGITSAKRSFAKATGIPTTRSGRRAKAGRMMGCLIPIIAAFAIISLVIMLCSAAVAESIDFATLTDDALAQLIADAQAEQRSRKASDDGLVYKLPCVLLDTGDFKLEATDVSVFDYENNVCIFMPVNMENNSEYDVEIDMSIEAFGDYDVRWTSSSGSVLVSSGKKVIDQMDFLITGISDTSIRDFEFEISVWDKGRSLYNLYRTETLNGLLP